MVVITVVKSGSFKLHEKIEQKEYASKKNSIDIYCSARQDISLTFGKSEKEAAIINDIVEHTMMAVLRADALGGYQSISIPDSFAMEYWELEQAKLK